MRLVVLAFSPLLMFPLASVVIENPSEVTFTLLSVWTPSVKLNEAGVMLVLGSDSHSPAEVAASFADAVKFAKSAGYDKICSFNNRKPALVQLG